MTHPAVVECAITGVPDEIRGQVVKATIVLAKEYKARAEDVYKRQVEEIGAAYGIGRDMHVGDTIIGIKGRVGFEAAAPMLLIGAHKFLEQYTLSKCCLLYTLSNLLPYQ